jgi:hypothetical protein
MNCPVKIIEPRTWDLFFENLRTTVALRIARSAAQPLDGSYDSHDSQQVNRSTIGEGTIVIRSDPSQGLEGLNRDLKRAQNNGGAK